MTDQAASTALQVRHIFDAKAAEWPEKYLPGGRLGRRLTRLAEAVTYHAPPGGSVLDLGCGTGELATAIAAAGWRAAGCDISSEMLSGAAAAGLGRAVGWVLLDPGWQRLPFRSGAFDAVVASSVLEYVDEPVAVLRECGRVLRPGGIVLCTVPDPRHPVRWLESAAGLAARLPLARPAGQRWLRLGSFLAYLRISRQRHPRRWWDAAAAQAGLRAAASRHDTAPRSPLRLLALHPHDDTREAR